MTSSPEVCATVSCAPICPASHCSKCSARSWSGRGGLPSRTRSGKRRPPRRKPLYVGVVAADLDIEALGLLDGLEGEARQERAQLIAWLLDRGFDLDHILGSGAAPLML